MALQREVVAIDPAAEPVAEPTLAAARLLYIIWGSVEILLVLRFVFKLIGVNTVNLFVAWLYTISYFFLAPFQGIFHDIATPGTQLHSVFEPSTLFAIVIYAVVFGIIIRFLAPRRRLSEL